MDHTKGMLGIREFFAIILVTIGTKLTDNTPTGLFNEVGNAAWITIIIMCLVSIIPIYLLTKVITSYENKNLVDIIYHLLGKHIGFFVILLLWLTETYSIVLSSAMYADIIETMYFVRTPILIIYIVLIGVAAYGAKKGIEYIGSAAWITLIGLNIALFVVLILSILQGRINYIFPIFGNGIPEILTEGTTNLSIFGEFLYFGFIVTSLRSINVYKKGIWIGLFYVSIVFMFALIGYVMLFDYVSIGNLNYPFHESIRYIQLGFLTNVESLFLPFWLVASFLRFSFYLYISALLFGALFKIKQFNYLVPSIAILIVFLGLIPEAPVFSLFNLREILVYITAPIFLLLPLVLWIAAKLKGEFKK
ncbi:GerAB/ArcD/ProY family transporter [Ureibacillus acetophenoni]|uniref:Spore germination protein (Amino acid permease) n=1 Tax=Ureibacillus acetophenoni TaxID=614649 RepID=A0A285UUI2_9BACL|nr:endospore germination permease [Ureibacillus acetophenoni]SOC45028.1 spore germination protein (amino acid permease) [Ureibacillus acetophenoni]